MVPVTGFGLVREQSITEIPVQCPDCKVDCLIELKKGKDGKPVEDYFCPKCLKVIQTDYEPEGILFDVNHYYRYNV